MNNAAANITGPINRMTEGCDLKGRKMAVTVRPLMICILLGLYAMHTLPVSYAGAFLILLAIVLFIAETQVTSYGILSLGGVVSLVMGSIMLLDRDPVSSAYINHVHEAREGARGASGSGGGGCGCN